MELKLIIFDLGGVLTLPENKNDPFKTISRRYNISDENFRNFFFKYFEEYHFKKTLSQYKFWEKTLREVEKDITPKEVNRVIEEFNENIINEFNEDMLELIQKIHHRYKLVLFSNSSREMDKAIFSSGIIRYFDRICLSHFNSFKKTNKKTFLEIINDFHLKPQEILLVDDKEKNLTEAKKLGINTILFKDYPSLVEKLKEHHISLS